MSEAKKAAENVDEIVRKINAAKLCMSDLDIIKKTIQINMLNRRLEAWEGGKNPEIKGDPRA
jgi:hypothetical protein